MRKILLTIFLGLALGVSSPAFADKKQTPEELFEEGSKMIIQALDLILKTIPQYAAPEVLENGDIIIRRIKPKSNQPNETDEGEVRT